MALVTLVVDDRFQVGSSDKRKRRPEAYLGPTGPINIKEPTFWF